MITEEKATHKPGDAWEIPDTGDIVNDGRFSVGGAPAGGPGNGWSGDDITIRHNKRGNVVFIDGHCRARVAQVLAGIRLTRSLAQPGPGGLPLAGVYA